MSQPFTNLPKILLQQSNYRLLGLVGQGQIGRVFCAIHRQTGCLVALKELEHQSFPTNKFLRELRFLLSLQHPNIVTCQALEHTPNGRYLVMDYCEGGTLRNLIQPKLHLSLIQTLKLIADVLAGLEHAHERGIVHCDIKPENILLSLDTTGWIARISDFGVARWISQETCSVHLGDTGSPAYMAPERFYGKYSPASDLYAVGVLLFELVAGYRPFSGLPGELMSAHLTQPVKIPNTIPFLLRSTISTALQKLPARRFASAAEMLNSIRLAIEVQSLTHRSTSFSIPTVVLSVSSLDNIQQEPLHAPVTILAIESQQVYQADASQVHCQTYASNALAGAPLHQWQMQLKASVQAIALRPQGCFALTQFRQHNSLIHSVYCLPRTQPLTLSGNQPKCALERYRLLSLECTGLAMTIAPQGRWMAIAKTTMKPDGEGSQTTFQILKPNLQPVKPPVTCLPSQLITLDSRHGIAISTQLGDEIRGGGTVFEVFNRRGDFIAALDLPVSLHLVTPSVTFRYRLLAVEQNNPTSALLIDLKPFRVFGILLEIAPAFIVAANWGYIVADRQGQIVLLDQDGQKIGAFHVPAAPTAIATFADSGLMIATWSGNQGVLYKVDLRGCFAQALSDIK